MARQLKPCGTDAAYRRHLRRGEPVDAACAREHRSAQRRRDRGARPVASLTLLPDVTPADAPAGVTDRLSEARWALQACTDAIAQGAPGLSGLLREHTRLVELVVQLEGAGKPDTNPLRAMLRERGLA